MSLLADHPQRQLRVSRWAVAATLLGSVVACAAPRTPAPQPTLASRASTVSTVVLVGDSLAEQASPYMQVLLGDRTLVPHVFGGTAPCDWLGKDFAATPADMVVISFIGNSSTACMADGAGGFLHGQALVDKYRTDLFTLVAQVRATGARVLLVGQPRRAGGGEADTEVTGVNLAYTALLQPIAVSWVDAGAAVEDATGAFAQRLPCITGEPECGADGTNVVRSDDGVHFCPGPNPTPCDVYSSGAFRFAATIVDALDQL
ncbi:MAG: hypothetical protein WCC60_17920 [Ilumatobacteraceae bacterium]